MRFFLWSFFLLGLVLPVSAFDTDDETTITQTATDRKPSLGDAITLTWSIIPDGVTMPDSHLASANEKGESDLVKRLDDLFEVGEGDRGADYTNRPWFKIMDRSFKSYERKMGLIYQYVEDDGADFGKEGKLGKRGDIRIGGTPLDGPRAYNHYPEQGSDMVMDSDNEAFVKSGAFRLVFIHEHAHGLGLRHQRITGNRGGSLSVVTDRGGNAGGPQFDDILALQRKYGDPLEKNGGNDSHKTAVDLGSLEPGKTLEVGTSVDGLRVKEEESDFLSIDDQSDRDFFQFELSAEAELMVKVVPVGPDYQLKNQAGEEVSMEATKQSDLTLSLYADGKPNEIKTDATGVGEKESKSMKVPAGVYRVKVGGKGEKAQMYRLEISAS